MDINKEKLVFNYKKDTTLKGSTPSITAKNAKNAKKQSNTILVVVVILVIILIIIILNKFKK